MLYTREEDKTEGRRFMHVSCSISIPSDNLFILQLYHQHRLIRPHKYIFWVILELSWLEVVFFWFQKSRYPYYRFSIHEWLMALFTSRRLSVTSTEDIWILAIWLNHWNFWAQSASDPMLGKEYQVTVIRRKSGRDGVRLSLIADDVFLIVPRG